MSSGLYVALSGARAQSRALDVTSSNVANSGTVGFKASRALFREKLVAAQGPDQRYAELERIGIDLTQGRVDATGNVLDLALEGKGFFAVQTPDGERYTRDGAFRIDSKGMMVNALGQQAIDDEGEAIQFPADVFEIEVSPEGDVYADSAFVGTLKIDNFNEPQLERTGANQFKATGEPIKEGEGSERPIVLSESLEGSNFNTVRGVVEIVKVSRTYQALLKMIESYKETEGRAATALGGPK